MILQSCLGSALTEISFNTVRDAGTAVGLFNMVAGTASGRVNTAQGEAKVGGGSAAVQLLFLDLGAARKKCVVGRRLRGVARSWFPALAEDPNAFATDRSLVD